MESLKVHDKLFKPYITAEQISEQVKRVASEIDRDYKNKKPLFIAILNGAFMFAADLFREVAIESEICFIKLASYKGVASSGQVVTAIGLDVDIVGREVIIIEDIIDTGKTLSHFLPQLKHHHPASLKIAALLHKPEAMVYDIKIHYLGFTVPNKFLVGYGLDYDGLGRNMKEIYQLV
jgi:hypoxanthine phosphoribosyltransferase